MLQMRHKLKSLCAIGHRRKNRLARRVNQDGGSHAAPTTARRHLIFNDQTAHCEPGPLRRAQFPLLRSNRVALSDRIASSDRQQP